MGTDLTVFANHNIDFSCGDYFKIKDKITEILNSKQLENINELKEKIRSFYDWQGYDHDEVRTRWHNKIDNYKDTGWEGGINEDFEYKRIHLYGIYDLKIIVTDRRMEFLEPGCRY